MQHKNKKQIYFKLLISVLILFFCFLLISCNIVQDILGNEDEDTTPPEIITYSPSDGKNEVARNIVIIIFFSESMDTLSTENAFSIQPDTSGSFVWEGDNTVLKFFPDEYLSANTEYHLVVSNTAEDLAGNKLTKEYSWSFTTIGSSTADTIPPPDVSSFSAQAGDGEITLSWVEPIDPDYVGVKIMRRADTYPASPDDGVQVYSGSGTSYTDTGLTNGKTYYYTAFSYDGAENYSTGVNASETPSGPKIIDDFESGDLTTAGWIIENSVTHPETGVVYPRASHENDVNINAYEGEYLLDLYSAELYGSNTDLVSLYINLTVPSNAVNLVYFYDSNIDDTGHGYSRVYIEESGEIVADTGWFKGDKNFGPWKEGKFDVQSLRGKNIKLWIGIMDDGDTWSGCNLFVDYIYFSSS